MTDTKWDITEDSGRWLTGAAGTGRDHRGQLTELDCVVAEDAHSAGPGSVHL